MKMAKASEKDIEAAGNAMSVLCDIASGYYPEHDDDAPSRFDADNPAHLRKFYELISATLDKSSGWPSRIIGGMCYVILYDANQIIDPDSRTLDLHPRFERVEKQRDELLKLAKFIKRGFDSGNIKSQPFLDFSAPNAASLELKSVYQEVENAIAKAEQP